MLQVPLLEYHHSLPTRVIIQLSLFIQNINWYLPMLINLSLIYLNFMRNSKKPFSCPKNIIKSWLTRIRFLHQSSKLVTELMSRHSSSKLPDQQRNSQKNILVPMKSLTKQVPYLGLFIYLKACALIIQFSMYLC